MDRQNTIASAISDREQAQVLFVDGHKVTIRDSRQENPSAIKAIREIVLANVVGKNG